MPIVRVAVLAAKWRRRRADRRLTEIALPAELPLREIIPAVRRIVAPSDDAVGRGRAAEPRAHRWRTFSLDATLNTVGVVDGDLLALQAVPAGPPAPRIVEDIADAAMIFSAAREKPWGTAHIQRGAASAAVGLILVATALAVAHRVVTGSVIGLFAVSGVAIAAVLGALLARAGSPRLATALAAAALPPVAAAFALAVPGDFGPPNIVLGAAGVAAWSIISITVGERAVALFTAAAADRAGRTAALRRSRAVDAERRRHRLRPDPGCAVDHRAGRAVVGVVRALPGAGHPRTRRSRSVGAAAARARGSSAPYPRQRLPPDRVHRRRRASRRHRLRRRAWPAVGRWCGAVGLVSGGRRRAGAALRARVWDSASCKAWLLGHSYLITTVLVGAVRGDRQLRRGVVGVGGAGRAGGGLGRGRAEPGDRATGDVLAADAPSARLRRRRPRCVGDSGDGLSGGPVHVGPERCPTCVRIGLAAASSTSGGALVVAVRAAGGGHSSRAGPAAMPPSGSPGPGRADGAAQPVRRHRRDCRGPTRRR